MKLHFVGYLVLVAILLGGCESPVSDTISEFSITYNANFATSGNSPTNQVKTEKSDIAVMTNSGLLERIGFTFTGWNTTANGSGNDYPEGAVYSEDADLLLYAKWAIVPAGGTENFVLNGSWNLDFGTTVFTDLVFSNSAVAITADFPDVVYSYDNAANTAILFWTYNSKFAKIDWTAEGTGFKVNHSEEVANLSLLDAAPKAFDYHIFAKYTASPVVFTTVPADGDTVKRTTNRIEIVFSHIMNTGYVSITPTGAIDEAEPETVWTHDYVNGRSTLALENVVFSEIVGNVSIQFFSSMRDCNGNSLTPSTVTFTTF